jgi:hypothetical protein
MPLSGTLFTLILLFLRDFYRAAGGALISLSDGSALDYSIGRDGIATGQVHAGGILAALSSPYSLYERLRSDL